MCACVCRSHPPAPSSDALAPRSAGAPPSPHTALTRLSPVTASTTLAGCTHGWPQRRGGCSDTLGLVLFGRTDGGRLPALSGRLLGVAAGTAGLCRAPRCLEHLSRAHQVPPRSSLPAGVVPGMMLAVMGTGPCRRCWAPATRRMCHPSPSYSPSVIYSHQKGAVVPRVLPGAGGTGCWVLSSSQGRARGLCSAAQLPPSTTASPALLHLHPLPTAALESGVSLSPEPSWGTHTPLQGAEAAAGACPLLPVR